MKLTNSVYLVGGGNLGFNLSNPFDCHMYVVKSGDELALIEVGAGLESELVLENMRQDGLDPDQVRSIFVTHYHTDHAGGLRRWRDLTGARVYASHLSAPAIRTGDAEAIGLGIAQRAGFYPVDYVFQPCPVDVEYEDGQQFPVGQLTLTAYYTPGHSQDHFSLLLQGGDRSYLFAGDTVFWGGTIILQNIADCDLQAYISTIERLSNLAFDALLPGHLTFSLRDGKRHIEAAVTKVRNLGIPRQAVDF